MSARTHDLLCAVIDEYRQHAPRDEAERILWRELLRTATSLANNSAEAEGTQSRQDFIHKFQICLKEARESLQLLRALHHAAGQRQPDLAQLANTCNEIVAILVASLRTAKAHAHARTRCR